MAAAAAGPYANQIINILLQTDNHASTEILNFDRPNALPDAQPTMLTQRNTANNQQELVATPQLDRTLCDVLVLRLVIVDQVLQ